MIPLHQPTTMTFRPHIACILTLATLTSSCSLDKEKYEKLEREVWQLRTDNRSMTEQLRKATTDLEVEKASRLRADEEVKATRAKNEALRKDLDAARLDLLNYRRDYQLQSRVRAVGQRIPTVATLDGKTYHDVLIRAVLVDTVQISHADGHAKITIANLGPQWLKRFDVGTTEPICLIDETVLKDACARASKPK